MAFEIQVTTDATDPHAQADWWAQTLGWCVEPQDEAFIKDMIAKGFAQEDETITHKGQLVWRTGAAIRHPDDVGVTPARRVLFQWVPEGTTDEPRTGRR